MSNKGYIYTIVSLLFGLLLLSVITLQYQTIKTTAELEPSKVRTDELHFFVESAKKDMTRAMAISGTRATNYLISFIIINNSRHGVDNASEALRDIILDGTVEDYSGTTHKILHMENDTMNGWLRKVNETGDELHFDVNITPISLEIYPYDESHFLEIFNLSFDVADRKGPSKAEMCRYKNNNTQIYVLVSFDGIEDPLYPIIANEHVDSYMNFATHVYSDNNASISEILGYAAIGNGTGGGKILDLSTLKTSDDLSRNITNFSNTSIEPIDYTVFVFNVSSVVLNGLVPDAQDALRKSGGVINYNHTNLAGMGYPYVANLSYINFTNRQYVVLRNGANHTVEYMFIREDIINQSYRVSANNTGPSFFDRLEGNLTLTEKFINDTIKARTLLGVNPNAKIGIESFVDVPEFANKSVYRDGFLPDFVDQSSVDYMHFNNSEGGRVYGTPWWFRLDGQHFKDYYLTPYAYDRAYVGVWHFDEGVGSTAYDSSRAPSTGTATGVTWPAGRHFSGVGLGGAAYVSAPNTDQLNVTSQITITAWINLTNLAGAGGIRPIVSKSSKLYSANPDSYMLFFGPGTNTNLNFVVGNNINQWSVRNVTYAIPGTITDKWYFVAGTWDNTTAKLYVNGTLVNYAAITGDMTSNTESLRIGNEIGLNYFIGTIDEVKIYNRTLSESEIMDEYIRMS
jgi:hypothetical protein